MQAFAPSSSIAPGTVDIRRLRVVRSPWSVSAGRARYFGSSAEQSKLAGFAAVFPDLREEVRRRRLPVVPVDAHDGHLEVRGPRVSPNGEGRTPSPPRSRERRPGGAASASAARPPTTIAAAPAAAATARCRKRRFFTLTSTKTSPGRVRRSRRSRPRVRPAGSVELTSPTSAQHLVISHGSHGRRP